MSFCVQVTNKMGISNDLCMLKLKIKDFVNIHGRSECYAQLKKLVSQPLGAFAT